MKPEFGETPPPLLSRKYDWQLEKRIKCVGWRVCDCSFCSLMKLICIYIKLIKLEKISEKKPTALKLLCWLFTQFSVLWHFHPHPILFKYQEAPEAIVWTETVLCAALAFDGSPSDSQQHSDVTRAVNCPQLLRAVVVPIHQWLAVTQTHPWRIWSNPPLLWTARPLIAAVPYLSVCSWNLICVFLRCSPPPPGMPELSALPSVWSHVSADLQHTVYFAGCRGNTGSWLKIYRWPLTALQWRVSRPHSFFGARVGHTFILPETKGKKTQLRGKHVSGSWWTLRKWSTIFCKLWIIQ